MAVRIQAQSDRSRVNPSGPVIASTIGRVIARERILGHTVNRLHYVDDRKRFPEIAVQEITQPVFIIGLPRTGTTILHDILAQDPANRVPMTWEAMFPSPPPAVTMIVLP